MKRIKIVLIAFCLIVIQNYAYAQNPSDYLILQDIGSYQFKTQSKNPITKKIKTILGYWVYSNAGNLIGADHFDLDHDDVSYETVYESDTTDLGVRTQVTQHTGGDSDRWLLHEMDLEYRNYFGIPDLSYTIKTIDGNKILYFAAGGRDYRWLSGNKIINIEYHDSQLAKPQPLEIVQAYLAKFPSTIPLMTLLQLRSDEYVIKWIKDEIDRRLWLCDKWNLHYQAGKATQKDLIYNLVRSMNVFLNYRQKYFDVPAQADLDLLSGYQQNNDLASIQTKLSEYKGWWAKNKGKSITFP